MRSLLIKKERENEPAVSVEQAGNGYLCGNRNLLTNGDKSVIYVR